MSKKVSIYGLIDPRTQELRYVGKSVNPKARLYQHISIRYGKSYTLNWIKSLKAEDLEPEMIIIEVVDNKDWKDAEIFWIGYFKSIGCRLTNYRKGGNGFDSEEVSYYNKTRVNSPSTRKKYAERTAKRNAKTWKLIHPDGKEEIVTDLQKRCREIFENPTSAGMELRTMRKTTGMGHYKGFRCIKISND